MKEEASWIEDVLKEKLVLIMLKDAKYVAKPLLVIGIIL